MRRGHKFRSLLWFCSARMFAFRFVRCRGRFYRSSFSCFFSAAVSIFISVALTREIRFLIISVKSSPRFMLRDVLISIARLTSSVNFSPASPSTRRLLLMTSKSRSLWRTLELCWKENNSKLLIEKQLRCQRRLKLHWTWRSRFPCDNRFAGRKTSQLCKFCSSNLSNYESFN